MWARKVFFLLAQVDSMDCLLERSSSTDECILPQQANNILTKWTPPWATRLFLPWLNSRMTRFNDNRTICLNGRMIFCLCSHRRADKLIKAHFRPRDSSLNCSWPWWRLPRANKRYMGHQNRHNKTLTNFTNCKDTSAEAECDECTRYSNGPFTLASLAAICTCTESRFLLLRVMQYVRNAKNSVLSR